MPRRFMRGGTGRIVLTVIAVACGVALVCAIDLVNRAVYAAFVDIIDTMAGRASLQVSAGEGALIPEETAADPVRARRRGRRCGRQLVAFTADGEQLTVHGSTYERRCDPCTSPRRSRHGRRRDRVPEPPGLGRADGRSDAARASARRSIELDTPTGRRDSSCVAARAGGDRAGAGRKCAGHGHCRRRARVRGARG
jgi:hypothetical protein